MFTTHIWKRSTAVLADLAELTNLQCQLYASELKTLRAKLVTTIALAVFLVVLLFAAVIIGFAGLVWLFISFEYTEGVALGLTFLIALFFLVGGTFLLINRFRSHLARLDVPNQELQNNLSFLRSQWREYVKNGQPQ